MLPFPEEFASFFGCSYHHAEILVIKASALLVKVLQGGLI